MTAIAAARAHHPRLVVAGGEPRPGECVFDCRASPPRRGCPPMRPAASSIDLPAARRSASGDLARVVHDGRVLLPLRGRHPHHVAGGRRRSVDARAGSRRRATVWIVCALTRPTSPGDARGPRDGRQTAPRRPSGTRPHRDDRTARHRPRTSATSSQRIDVLKLNDEEAETLVGSAGEVARSRRPRGDPHARLAGRVGRDARARRARSSGTGRRTRRPDRCGRFVLGGVRACACTRRRSGRGRVFRERARRRARRRADDLGRRAQSAVTSEPPSSVIRLPNRTNAGCETIFPATRASPRPKSVAAATSADGTNENRSST